MKHLILFLFLGTLFGSLSAQPLPIVDPADAGMDPGHLWRVDGLIHEAIKDKETPGAVLAIVRDGKIVYRKAYGMMRLEPSHRRMRENTIFDMASITKPVATATALMILVDRGIIRLDDPVSHFIPGFMSYSEKDYFEDARIIHLLTHSAGLPAYAPVDELSKRFGRVSPDSLMNYFSTATRITAPGNTFLYSGPSYITLQMIIESITGESLHSFTQKNIFEPLGMINTTFMPGVDKLASIAPTIKSEDGLISGAVHDPLANTLMGGISGNAGLFSTADDLAIFATMMMNEGVFNNTRILSPASVKKMTQEPVLGAYHGRGLGWDLNSNFSSNQGNLFGRNTYGHTGYTGTSIMIDPDTKTAVILLTNRVYPDDTGSVVRLRGLIANVVAASIIN
ncbi:MAG: serine hydrolase domain-containing protein [Balneolales bacterium]